MLDSADFLRARFGRTGREVFRLGLAATYLPGDQAIRRGLDEGINYLFAFAFDRQMTRVIREMKPSKRESVLIATGGSNMLLWRASMKATLNKALRRLKTDYIDVFHYLGILKPEHLTTRVRDELAELRNDPRVKAVAVSCHDRTFAGQLAANNDVDVLMLRYNAAHRGAEREIFPHVARHNTGVVSYTATRWGRLLNRPPGWPAEKPVATAGQCYRFVLSSPHVHIALTAPRSERELLENIQEVRRGPLSADEMQFMHEFGDYVHGSAGWFMGS